MAIRNQPNVDALVDRLHRYHPDLTIVGQPALPLEGDTGAGYGRLTISSPTSPCEYTLDLRADGISLSIGSVEPYGGFAAAQRSEAASSATL